jgi:hypothetical protein
MQRFTLQSRTRPDWKPITVDTNKNINDNHHDGPRILFVIRLLIDDGSDWRRFFRFNGNMFDES